ncbi:uncharacterized protein ACIB01_014775 [Guaruba guarouba]
MVQATGTVEAWLEWLEGYGLHHILDLPPSFIRYHDSPVNWGLHESELTPSPWGTKNNLHVLVALLSSLHVVKHSCRLEPATQSREEIKALQSVARELSAVLFQFRGSCNRKDQLLENPWKALGESHGRKASSEGVPVCNFSH